jgi:hypothetical protein
MQKAIDSALLTDVRQTDAVAVEATLALPTAPEPDTARREKSLRDKVRKNDQYLGTLLG